MSNNILPYACVIWAERLTVWGALFLYIRCRLTPALVYYDEHRISRGATAVLSVLKRLNMRLIFKESKLTLQVEDGPLFLDIIQDRIEVVTDAFLAKYMSADAEWKRQMVKSYIASAIRERMLFAARVENKKNGVNAARHVLFFTRSPVNSLLIKFYEDKGFRVCESVSLQNHIIFFLEPLVYLMRALLSVIKNGIYIRHDGTGRPAIWIEYADILFPRNRFMLFWHQWVDSKEFDIVCYFDRHDTPLTSERAKTIEQYGMKWIDCHDIFKKACLRPADIKKILNTGILFKGCMPWWLRMLWLHYNILFETYLSVFRRFRVRMLMQHQETWWGQVAQAKALETSGGIMAGFQWSNYPIANMHIHLHPQQIFFVWGKAMFETLHRKGNSCRHILPSGIWMLPQDAAPAGIDLIAERYNFIIGIFDVSVSVSNSGYVAPDAVERFYLSMLDLLEENEGWGGVIKSKKYGLEDIPRLFCRGKDIYERIKRLIDNKRIVFLDFIVDPLTVAVRANLSVCCGLSSVGIMAGAIGCRAISWDASNNLNHPIYADKRQKVLYTSIEEFKNAIISASRGDTTVGDFSAWQTDFNHFDDCLAPQRVGKLIETYMAEVIKTGDAESSLDIAVNRYIEENGVKRDFFEIRNWWGTPEIDAERKDTTARV